MPLNPSSKEMVHPKVKVRMLIKLLNFESSIFCIFCFIILQPLKVGKPYWTEIVLFCSNRKYLFRAHAPHEGR